MNVLQDASGSAQEVAIEELHVTLLEKAGSSDRAAEECSLRSHPYTTYYACVFS